MYQWRKGVIMGWAYGSLIAVVFLKIIKLVPKEKQKVAAKKAVDVLFDNDWDCADECPELVEMAYPHYFDEED